MHSLGSSLDRFARCGGFHSRGQAPARFLRRFDMIGLDPLGCSLLPNQRLGPALAESDWVHPGYVSIGKQVAIQIVLTSAGCSIDWTTSLLGSTRSSPASDCFGAMGASSTISPVVAVSGAAGAGVAGGSGAAGADSIGACASTAVFPLFFSSDLRKALTVNRSDLFCLHVEASSGL